MKTQPYITFTKVILLSQLKNEQKNEQKKIDHEILESPPHMFDANTLINKVREQFWD
jgi:hypothetical protein